MLERVFLQDAAIYQNISGHMESQSDCLKNLEDIELKSSFQFFDTHLHNRVKQAIQEKNIE